MQSKFNKFETVIVIRTEIADDTIDAFHARVFDQLTKLGGFEVKFEVWGKRKLAYEIKKNMKGIYIYYLFLAPPTAIDELERSLRLNENVLRFLTVRLEDNIDPENYDTTSEADISFKRLRTEEDEEAEEAAKEAAKAEKPEAKPEAKDDADDDDDDDGDDEPKGEDESADKDAEGDDTSDKDEE